jgi:hypothetical protein
LERDAALQTFIDIADDRHDLAQVDEILALTDNMPLAINLLAHLVDSEGCPEVLARWKEEKTLAISQGSDVKRNLDLSISLSLSGPRMQEIPHAKDLLSLLSVLPDGLSDVELLQSKLPIPDIQLCKVVLIRTALAYIDPQKRLKVLVPIKEYVLMRWPPQDNVNYSLLQYFGELLQFHKECMGTQLDAGLVARIKSNQGNIQHILRNALTIGHPDIINTINSAVELDSFSMLAGHGPISLVEDIQNLMPKIGDKRIEVHLISAILKSCLNYQIRDAETLIAKGMKNLEHFDDAGIKCGLFIIQVA